MTAIIEGASDLSQYGGVVDIQSYAGDVKKCLSLALKELQEQRQMHESYARFVKDGGSTNPHITTEEYRDRFISPGDMTRNEQWLHKYLRLAFDDKALSVAARLYSYLPAMSPVAMERKERAVEENYGTPHETEEKFTNTLREKFYNSAALKTVYPAIIDRQIRIVKGMMNAENPLRPKMDKLERSVERDWRSWSEKSIKAAQTR